MSNLKKTVEAGDIVRFWDTSGFKYPNRVIGKNFSVKSVQGNGRSAESVVHIDVYSPNTPRKVVDYGVRRDRVIIVKKGNDMNTSKNRAGIYKVHKPAPGDTVKPTFTGHWYLQGKLDEGKEYRPNWPLVIEYSGKQNPRYQFLYRGDVYRVTWDWMKDAKESGLLTRETVDYAKKEKEAARIKQITTGEWLFCGSLLKLEPLPDTSPFTYSLPTQRGPVNYTAEYIEHQIAHGYMVRPYTEHGPVPVDHVDHMVTIQAWAVCSGLVPGVVYVTHDEGCDKGFHIVRTGEEGYLLCNSASQRWWSTSTPCLTVGRNLSPIYDWPAIPRELVESSGLADVWAAVPAEVTEDKQ